MHGVKIALLGVKIALLGASGVGKSSVVNRIVSGEAAKLAPELTIAAAYAQTTLGNYKLQIWDTAGSERFRSFVPMYLRGARVILAVYDVTDVRSLEYVANERKRLIAEQNMPESVVWILIGNKADMPVQNVREVDALKVASDWCIHAYHFRVSAKYNTNIDKVMTCVRAVLDSMDLVEERAPTLTLLPQENMAYGKRTERRTCC